MSFLALIFLTLSSALAIDTFDIEIENCKQQASEPVCVAKVLKEFIKKTVSPPSSTTGVYCRCETDTGNYSRLVRITPHSLGETIASHLDPNLCVQALRFPPCI